MAKSKGKGGSAKPKPTYPNQKPAKTGNKSGGNRSNNTSTKSSKSSAKGKK